MIQVRVRPGRRARAASWGVKTVPVARQPARPAWLWKLHPPAWTKPISAPLAETLQPMLDTLAGLMSRLEGLK